MAIISDVLAPLVAKSPGRRVPRCVDGAEMALRAVLGQHISTAAARTHAGRLATLHGDTVSDASGGLQRLFPLPEALHDVDLAMPSTRRATFDQLVCALASGRLVLGPGSDRVEALDVLTSLPGIGPWTKNVISMRALGDPDAFLETDLGVRRSAEHLGLRATPAQLVEKFGAHGDVTSLALALKEDKDINSRIGYKEAAKLLLGES